MKRLKNYSAIIVLLLFTVSCAYNASMVKVSYNVLAVSSQAYDVSMKTMADLDARGLLPREKKTEIISAATTYYSNHNSAVELLAKYQETKDLQDQQLLEHQLAIMSETLTSLLNLIKPYLED